MTNNSKNITNLQNMLLSSRLYLAVVEAESDLRNPSEYDVGAKEERQLAILCYGIEKALDKKEKLTSRIVLDAIDSLYAYDSWEGGM